MKFIIDFYFLFIPFFRAITTIIFVFNLALACIFYFVMTKEMISTGQFLAIADGKPSLISTILLYLIVSLFPVLAYLARLLATKFIPRMYVAMFPEIKSNPRIQAHLDKSG